MKTAAALALALLTATVPGCSFWAAWEQHVVVIPSEPAAQVYVDGQPVGTGTLDLLLNCGDPHEIRAVLDGRVATALIGTRLSPSGSLDVFFGVLLIVPLVGLMTPGASELDRSCLLLTLPPAAPPASTAPAAAR